MCKYQIGQYAVAQNEVNCDSGNITEITQSTGTKKGILYKIGINYYFESDIIKVVDAKPPIIYWKELGEIERSIKQEICDIVQKYGKRNETKKKGIRYIMTLPNNYTILARDILGQIFEIKKIIVNKADDKNEWYLTFVDVNGNADIVFHFHTCLWYIYNSLFSYLIYKK